MDSFVSYLNQCIPSIKFTMEASNQEVNFLDTTVKLVNQHIETDLYCKPTDAHNYLLYKSAHPRNCKDSIPYSQFLRIRRICTNIEDFDKHIINFCLHFQRRGYPPPLLEKAALAARRIPRNNLLNKNKTDTETKASKLIMVTRYHPHHDILRDIVIDNWDFLGKTTTTQFLHDQKIMVGYRRPKNLRDMIVRADVRLKVPKSQRTLDKPPKPQMNAKSLTFPTTHTKHTKQGTITDFIKKQIENSGGVQSSTSATNITGTNDIQPMRSQSLTNLVIPTLERNKCLAKKLCRYCPLLNKSGKIICNVTKITHETKTNITCRSSNLIYCITCKKCQMQYVGQTKRTLMERFQGHLGKITKAHKKTKGNQEPTQPEKLDPIGLHFSKPNHDEKDLNISVLAFITLTPHSDKALRMRLKVEKKWIHQMRCPAPYGLNIFD